MRRLFFLPWLSARRATVLPVLLGLLVLLSAAPASAQTSKRQPDVSELAPNERLGALVDRVRSAQQTLKSLQADFVQRRESEMLIDAQEAHGTFSYQAPDRVRWEFTTPDPISMVITDQKMVTWYRDIGRADELAIGRYSDQVFKYLGATGSLDRLLEYFEVELVTPADRAEPLRLDLEPKYKRIEKKLTAMSIWIDRASYLPVRLRYTEPSGDLTEYRFEDLEINGSIPAARFRLDIPDGVERRRLGSGG